MSDIAAEQGGSALATAVGGAAVAVGGAALLLALTARFFASRVYDVLICSMTRTWYAAVLKQLAPGTRVLDIGIGTATALLQNRSTLEASKLSVVGLDYDAEYIAAAQAQVDALGGLDGRLKVICKSIFDADLRDALADVSGSQEPFDAAYFSGSWTLMPDPVTALRIAAALVREDGRVYVTQTFQLRAPPLLSSVKPMLKHLTRIDFGELHYEADLQRFIAEAARPQAGWALEVEHEGVVPGSIDNRWQRARLVVFKRVKRQE